MKIPIIDPADFEGSPLPSNDSPLPSSGRDFLMLEDCPRLTSLHREQIRFLEGESAKVAYDSLKDVDLLCGDDGWGNKPFSGGGFKSVELYQIAEPSKLKKWMYRRGVAFASQALVLPVFSSGSTALFSTWKMIVKFSPELFSGDNLVVVSLHLKWCLHYHHDGHIHFAKEPVFEKFQA